MRLAEEYVRLRSHWYEQGEQQAFHVTIAELAAALCCTTRNARLITARLVEAGWIVFISGRGRGNTSVLTFCQSWTQVALDEAQERVQRGDVAAALAWIRQPHMPEQVETGFMSWLGEYFGYTTGHSPPAEQSETLRLPIYRPVVCLDPADAVFAFDTQLVDQLYSRLVEYRAEDRTLLPGLAHDWECKANGTQWSFYLYKHIRFHDDRLLTAEDVVASLQRLQTGQFAHSWLLDKVTAIHASHPYTVVITLREPNYWLPLLLSHSGASIVPQDIEQHSQQEHALPVGTGAYRLIERTLGRCVLERFDRYYGTGALIDRIEILIVPEQEAAVALGNGHGMLTVLTGEWDTTAFDHLPRQNVQTGVSMLMLNRRQGILGKDEALRQALYYGVDREALVAAMGDTYTAPARGLILMNETLTANPMRWIAPDITLNESPQGIAYTPPVDEAELDIHHSACSHPSSEHSSTPCMEYDPQRAIQQLQQSAYAGNELQLYTFQRHEQAAYWLREAYRHIGIRIAVHIVSWSDMMSEAILAQADIILFEAVLGGELHRQLEYMHSNRSLIRRMLPQELLTEVQPLTHQLLRSLPAVEGIRQGQPDRAEQEVTALSASVWMGSIHVLLQGTYSAVFLAERSAGGVVPSFLRGVHMNERGWVDFSRLYVVATEKPDESNGLTNEDENPG